MNFPIAPSAPPGCRLIPVSGGHWAIVDAEDFDRLSRFKWQAAFTRSSQTYYAKRRFYPNGSQARGVNIKMHREIVGLDSPDVDHKNGNGLDNRKENLRPCTASQNLANSRLSASNRSGLKGVSWAKKYNRWRVVIVVNGKQRHVGLFTDKYDAARAFDRAAVDLFGEFARTNEMMGLLPKETP